MIRYFANNILCKFNLTKRSQFTLMQKISLRSNSKSSKINVCSSGFTDLNRQYYI